MSALASALDARRRWYARLAMPAWKPPDFAIPIVWTGLYGLVAAALFDARRAKPAARRRFFALFMLNAGLHFAWQGLFFGARRPDWALAETAPYWLSTFALFAQARRVSPRAERLLAPYFVWVSFAAALNADIAARNPSVR